MTASYAEVVRERDEHAAKLEKIAGIIADLSKTPRNEWIAQMLDNVLFPCECPGEHCGECGCCPDGAAS